jgi:hypothetical protein
VKTSDRRAGTGRRWLATLAMLIVALTALLSGGQSTAAAVNVAVDARARLGTLDTVLSTQIKYPGSLEAPGARQLFRGFGAPLIRILTSADGCCWPGGPGPMIPAWSAKGSWDFSSLDSVVSDVTGAGAGPVLNILQAPAWMWSCPSGTIVDPTFGEFADYMARLVAYYNRGSFVAEDGRTITNPAGVANRITYWELWNEPDLPAIACSPHHPNITAAQYVTMWNAAVPRMLAVDPALRLIGPTTPAPAYVTALLAGAQRKPDVVSFHGYGGWLNTQSDQFLLNTLDQMVDSLLWARTIAPVPIWYTELNVQATHEEDPARRPYNAYGAAWGASAFRRLALGGAAAIFQYEFAHTGSANFQMVDFITGQPRLPYWRDYYLARYFPPGSTLLSSTSTLAGVETLAVRAPASRDVNVLVVNRQVDSPTAVGGRGLPATVQVSVRNLQEITQVTLRTFDDTTPLAGGPPPVPLPVGNSATVTFSGYGAAILTFVSNAEVEEREVAGRPGDRQPPTVPSGLAAKAISANQIDLVWTASTDNVGVTRYLVERCAGAGCSSFTQIGIAPATGYSDTGLPAASAFAYRVRAADAANNLSGYSNVAGATTHLANGLVAAYGFNEGAGTTTADASGRGHTASIAGATWTTNGKYGNALAFNGTTSYVDLGNAADFQITGSMTWSAWIIATADPHDDGQIVAKSSSAGSAWRPQGWHFKTSPDTGPHTFGVGVSPDGLALTQRYSTTVRALGTWYHVAGVYDAAARTLHIYVNGVLDDGVLRGTVPAAQFNGPASVNIGRHSGGFYFQGTIDEVRLYNRALTQAEIQADMNTPLGTTPSPRG